MKKFLFIILLFILAFVSALILLVVAWYFQWPPWVALFGPLAFLVLPLLWWLLSIGVRSLRRRQFSRRVLTEGKELGQGDPGPTGLEQDWDRGLLALRSVKAKRGLDPVATANWFLFLEPTRPGKGSLLRESGAVTDFLDPGGDSQAPRPGVGLDWYFCGDGVLLEPRGFLALGGDAPGPQGRPGPLRAGDRLGGPPAAPGQGGLAASVLEKAPAPGGGPPGLPPAAGGPVPGPVLGPGLGPVPGQGPGAGGTKEWEDFLRLIPQAGRRIPVNGIVLTIPGGLLEREREAELLALSSRTRKMLDRLFRESDSQAPCFIMLSELGGLPGLQEALAFLGGGSPVGILVGEGEGGAIPQKLASELGDSVMDGLLDGLGSDPEGLSPLLVAKRSLRRLERPLSLYLGGLAHESPFSPVPRVRGLFLEPGPGPSPGAAPGKAKAAEAQEPGPLGAGAEPAPALQGFLQGTLPGNAGLSRRLNLPGGGRQRRLLLLGALLFLGAFALGLLFYFNVLYHRELSQVAQGFRAGEGAMATVNPQGQDALFRANAMSYLLGELESVRGRRLIRGVGPDRADAFILEVERDFLTSFEVFMGDLFRSLDLQLSQITDESSMEYAFTLRQILWLLSVFSDAQKGLDYASHSERFPLIPSGFQGPSAPYWDLSFCKLLMEYISRKGEGYSALMPLSQLRASLNTAVGMNKDGGMGWITRWPITLPGLESVKVSDFWPQYDGLGPMTRFIPEASAPELSGLYTLPGREIVRGALAELRQSYRADMGVLEKTFQDYQAAYDRDYVAAWGSFYNCFAATAENVRKAQGVADLYGQRRMGTDTPYDGFIASMAGNLAPFLGEAQKDGFLRNLELDSAVRVWHKARTELDSASHKTLVKRIGGYSEVMDSLRGGFPNIFYRTDFVERVYAAEGHFASFLNAEAEILSLLHNRPREAESLAGIFYGGAAPAQGAGQGGTAPGPGQAAQGQAAPGGAPAGQAGSAGTAFQAAKDAIKGYEASLYQDLPGATAADPFLTEARGSLRQLRSLLTGAAATALNSQWETDVYLPTLYLSPDQASERLFGPDGLILKFANGPAAPFLENRGLGGYAPRQWEGEAFPFSKDFLSMVSMGGSKWGMQPFLESYPVTLTLTGALVDQGAREKPERTTLYLRSGASVTTLESYNFPVTQTFDWKPLEDGETGIEIGFPSLTLYVHYGTEHGFPTFLNDIVSSGFSFTPDDFPDHRDQLKAMGITRIRLLVQADGAYPVVNFLNLSKAQVPKGIIVGAE